VHLVERIVEEPHSCAYLPEQRASLEVRVMFDVSPAETQALLERGWRRFGPLYFRPLCAQCGECVSLRVPAAAFTPSKSQRRAARACSRLRRVVGKPRCDRDRLALYAKWHGEREEQRGWNPNPQTAERYAMEFSFPHPCAREAAFYDDDAGGRLVGLGLFDETPDLLSAVFFFHDPDYAKLSLGTANVLGLIDDARLHGKAHVYLGYCVAGCASLKYKASYRPHEHLVGRPGFNEEALWALDP
jgi:arginine-tRNA-protein transferase